ncbi:MAG TPA: hypothetical protein QGF63_09925 [Alphaproteobacteria bacterium]|jgi:hypothetical protein|nr:hypothetical protein [Alphaproteobacteria bacterium]MDP6269701.1 hypothetical protein [Alphaproteobacteria bacterium]MDP7429034.1 hypothetical protein [Alphaproteobacteria bacterium]HJM50153.1 hypothetical protein [Alphaproteobacteria bacterium]
MKAQETVSERLFARPPGAARQGFAAPRRLALAVLVLPALLALLALAGCGGPDPGQAKVYAAEIDIVHDKNCTIPFKDFHWKFGHSGRKTLSDTKLGSVDLWPRFAFIALDKREFRIWADAFPAEPRAAIFAHSKAYRAAGAALRKDVTEVGWLKYCDASTKMAAFLRGLATGKF